MKTKPVVFLLALTALFAAMLMPPEAYPAGKMAVILSSTFAFIIALVETKIPKNYVRAGVWIFGLLLAHTFAVSVDVFRSLDMVSVLWSYYCLIGFFAYATCGFETLAAAGVVLLSMIVSGYGLYQYFWGFDELHQLITTSGSSDVLTAPALQVVATRRVFSTLALPGTLWGFLVCALPFHALLWRRHRLLDALLLVSGAMSIVACFLTRSFGFLAGMLVLAISALWLRHRRLMWNKLTLIVVILAVAGGLFYSARRGVIEGADPAGLRFKNWVSAWNIFQVNPLGTGLNTFGVVYPEYMQPSANETQYVHNTPLQLLSELGYPLLLALIIAALVRAEALFRKPQLAGPYGPFLMAALAVWVAHNLIDIDVYFGSVGVLGAVIIGLLLARPQAQFTGVGRWNWAAAVLATLVILFSGVDFISSELQHRAQIEYENKKLLEANDTLLLARQICPINSSLYHDSGEIQLELSQTKHNPQYLSDAIASFRNEIALSPRTSGAYIGYGLCLSTENKLQQAIEQVRIAQQLYPSSTYIQSIARLVQRRLE